jgi:hypothetical protein
LSIEFFSVRVVFSQETPIGNVFEILFTSETCSLKRDNGIYLFIWFRDSPVFFQVKNKSSSAFIFNCATFLKNV